MGAVRETKKTGGPGVSPVVVPHRRSLRAVRPSSVPAVHRTSSWFPPLPILRRRRRRTAGGWGLCACVRAGRPRRNAVFRQPNACCTFRVLQGRRPDQPKWAVLLHSDALCSDAPTGGRNYGSEINLLPIRSDIFRFSFDSFSFSTPTLDTKTSNSKYRHWFF